MTIAVIARAPHNLPLKVAAVTGGLFVRRSVLVTVRRSFAADPFGRHGRRDFSGLDIGPDPSGSTFDGATLDRVDLSRADLTVLPNSR